MGRTHYGWFKKDGSCKKKIHKSHQAAQEQCWKDIEKYPDEHHRIYQCPNCSWFHITTMTKAEWELKELKENSSCGKEKESLND